MVKNMVFTCNKHIQKHPQWVNYYNHLQIGVITPCRHLYAIFTPTRGGITEKCRLSEEGDHPQLTPTTRQRVNSGYLKTLICGHYKGTWSQMPIME